MEILGIRSDLRQNFISESRLELTIFLDEVILIPVLSVANIGINKQFKVIVDVLKEFSDALSGCLKIGR